MPAVNFDMQRLASLLVGDEIVVRRSAHSVKFLHPRGWSYATLRKKLRWNEGVAMLHRLSPCATSSSSRRWSSTSSPALPC